MMANAIGYTMTSSSCMDIENSIAIFTNLLCLEGCGLHCTGSTTVGDRDGHIVGASLSRAVAYAPLRGAVSC